MTLDLLDLLNGSALQCTWNGSDRDIVLAHLASLQRRVEGVCPVTHVRVRVNETGRSVVMLDGASIAEFLPEADEYGRRGVACAHRAAEDIRQRAALPEWPHNPFLNELSPAARHELLRWRE